MALRAAISVDTGTSNEILSTSISGSIIGDSFIKV